MIPAEGELFLPDSQKVKYKFAKDPKASVHVGWTLGLYSMMSDILKHVKEANKQGIYNIYITGHSQGGALSHLLRAAFEYMPDEKLSKKNKFKVYAFAAPKPGNRFFAYDYASYTTFKNPSYTIINREDWVPMTPFSVQSPENMVESSPFALFEKNEFNMPMLQAFFMKRMYKSMRDPIIKAQKKLMKSLGTSVEKRIKKVVGDFNTPEPLTDFSYFPVGIQVILQPMKTQSKDALIQTFWQHFPAHYAKLIDEQF